MSKQLRFTKLDYRAKTPVYATDGAGAFDIATIDTGSVPPTWGITFRTGLAFEIPEGYSMFIFSRSGHGFKHGVRLSNAVGILDSDFRGELRVKLHNDGDSVFEAESGDRIAQAVIIETPRYEFIEVDALSPTERGTNGYGSTGVK